MPTSPIASSAFWSKWWNPPILIWNPEGKPQQPPESKQLDSNQLTTKGVDWLSFMESTHQWLVIYKGVDYEGSTHWQQWVNWNSTCTLHYHQNHSPKFALFKWFVTSLFPLPVAPFNASVTHFGVIFDTAVVPKMPLEGQVFAAGVPIWAWVSCSCANLTPERVYPPPSVN